jgi:hypothetical protein
MVAEAAAADGETTARQTPLPFAPVSSVPKIGTMPGSEFSA